MGDHVAVDVGELVASRAREAAGLMPSGKEEAEALIGMVFVFKQDILDFWFQYMLLILFASDSCYYYSWL
jgi:uncharacterized membrane protein (UPF0127 family)